MLKTETDTPEMKERIKQVAMAMFGHEPDDLIFEHGQWWLKYASDERCDNDQEDQNWFEETFGYDCDEVTYSVVDAEGGESIDGFDFEKV